MSSQLGQLVLADMSPWKKLLILLFIHWHPKLHILKTKGSVESGNKWRLIWRWQESDHPKTPPGPEIGNPLKGRSLGYPSELLPWLHPGPGWKNTKEDLNYTVVQVVWVWCPCLGTFIEVYVCTLSKKWKSSKFPLSPSSILPMQNAILAQRFCPEGYSFRAARTKAFEIIFWGRTWLVDQPDW